ncbi:hypothetical protein K788_0006851 [Paraburkholderia caribensis MBA4]|uniref:Uncharacterized protein n=1 Tax=Paraburkholderia caribensis MBA4 TaxID=1323664 RepID=A0A0P0R6Y2_9BURK|nr:hypothetical protein K788_0006851 [Paraburkholderia caribensis MBA4]
MQSSWSWNSAELPRISTNAAPPRTHAMRMKKRNSGNLATERPDATDPSGRTSTLCVSRSLGCAFSSNLPTHRFS